MTDRSAGERIALKLRDTFYPLVMAEPEETRAEVVETMLAGTFANALGLLTIATGLPPSIIAPELISLIKQAVMLKLGEMDESFHEAQADAEQARIVAASKIVKLSDRKPANRT